MSALGQARPQRQAPPAGVNDLGQALATAARGDADLVRGGALVQPLASRSAPQSLAATFGTRPHARQYKS
jgi:hypothetical protein